jgi:hypothetical protein
LRAPFDGRKGRGDISFSSFLPAHFLATIISLPLTGADMIEIRYSYNLRDLVAGPSDLLVDLMLLRTAVARAALSLNYFDAVRETMRRERHEVLPEAREIWHQQPFLFAEAFISSLDLIGALFTSLSVKRPAVLSAKDEFYAKFPHLRRVRNSIAHVDERAQAVGPRGKKIQPSTPTVPGLIEVAGGGTSKSIMIGNLVDRVYSTMLADGSQGSVEVSGQSLQHVEDAVNAVFDACAK